MSIRIMLIILLNAFALTLLGQTQTIKGIVLDESSGMPISFANILIKNTSPALGAVSEEDGSFSIDNVPIGRYDIEGSFIGYQSTIKKDITINSSKIVYIEIKLLESINSISEIVVKPKVDKERALNSMSLISSRMLNVEEANRYAGGFDDPARLASSFAGTASGVNNNGIVVRGNSAKSMQWKLEGIEIPNPNHFSDLVSFGGGALTALSSQLLANSDFMTGAFPSEYNNALSGVFDIKMRRGNNDEREHTFQLGALGIDFASEGPFRKGKEASYLFDYRYSTFGLVGKITGAEEGIEYQDASFKLNFPTKRLGTFSVWGIGLIDGIIIAENRDTVDWEYNVDGERYDAEQYMVATGANHKIILNDRSYLHSTIGFTKSNTDWQVSQLDSNLKLNPETNVFTTNSTIELKTILNTKFNSTHTNRTGISFTNLGYNTLIQTANDPNISGLQTLVDVNGSSALLSGFSSSNIRLRQGVTLNLGINTQYFSLNDNYTIEPRIALKWELNNDQEIGFAYGLHSRLEKINFFFTKNPITNEYNNKDLDFTKSNHFVVSYSKKISPNLHLKIEPYFQFLYDVPVIKDSYYSFINQNFRDAWFINDDFENSGNGRNYGLDVTLEKFMSNGFYYMMTASIFKSEYSGGDKIWRNTKFDKSYVLNFLAGKEWQLGQNNRKVFGLNIRTTLQGGDRYIPSLVEESTINQDVVFDYNNAFNSQFDPSLIIHFSVNYTWNKENTTQEVSLKVINATAYGDFRGFEYNLKTDRVDATEEVIVIPNLSYKISF